MLHVGNIQLNVLRPSLIIIALLSLKWAVLPFMSVVRDFETLSFFGVLDACCYAEQFYLLNFR